MPTHVVCRGCSFEALIPVASRVERVVDDHEDETGHEVAHQEVDNGQRLVTDGGLSREELRSRIWSRSSTPAAERSRCPECLSMAIRYRSEGIYCKQCTERYPAAVEPHEEEYPEAVTDGGPNGGESA